MSCRWHDIIRTIRQPFFYKTRVRGEKRAAMINIKNKEQEPCAVLVVDINGKVCYETNIQPNASLVLDINTLISGIYTLIFTTETTKFIQQIVKYW